MTGNLEKRRILKDVELRLKQLKDGAELDSEKYHLQECITEIQTVRKVMELEDENVSQV